MMKNFIVLLLLAFPFVLFANNTEDVDSRVLISDVICIQKLDSAISKIVADSLRKDVVLKEKSKIVAAVLSFPFPFGLFGLHRMYLGTSPLPPLVYIATFGGCFGILPFIDFVLIMLSDKEMMDIYQRNKHIFMWEK